MGDTRVMDGNAMEGFEFTERAVFEARAIRDFSGWILSPLAVTRIPSPESLS